MSFLTEALQTPLKSYPLEGPWRYRGFPERILIGDWPFSKARWSQPYPGVVAQYREECVHGSMHAKVFRDGLGGFWWVIDHEDAFNPDRGKPLAHFFFDYEPGRVAKPAVVALIGLLLTKTLVPLAPGL